MSGEGKRYSLDNPTEGNGMPTGADGYSNRLILDIVNGTRWRPKPPLEA